MEKKQGAIGIFDSGYGGLTILQEIRRHLPNYDFIYLGDNARAPYGSRSFEVVYKFTWQAVSKLFEMECPLVILACNTASAKALRSIQQLNLPQEYPQNRVLGIIRPTVEALNTLTRTRHIGLLGTEGTVRSGSYLMEIEKLYNDIHIESLACPMWVPLVENREYDRPGADFFVKKDLETLLSKDPLIDLIILGCTHYPLLLDKIRNYLPAHIKCMAQGEYVAHSLHNYLRRHPEMDSRCAKNGKCSFYTTESTNKFRDSISLFLKEQVAVHSVALGE